MIQRIKTLYCKSSNFTQNSHQCKNEKKKKIKCYIILYNVYYIIVCNNRFNNQLK